MSTNDAREQLRSAWYGWYLLFTAGVR